MGEMASGSGERTARRTQGTTGYEKSRSPEGMQEKLQFTPEQRRLAGGFTKAAGTETGVGGAPSQLRRKERPRNMQCL